MGYFSEMAEQWTVWKSKTSVILSKDDQLVWSLAALLAQYNCQIDLLYGPDSHDNGK